jgi:hypothetical protein
LATLQAVKPVNVITKSKGSKQWKPITIRATQVAKEGKEKKQNMTNIRKRKCA